MDPNPELGSNPASKLPVEPSTSSKAASAWAAPACEGQVRSWEVALHAQRPPSQCSSKIFRYSGDGDSAAGQGCRFLCQLYRSNRSSHPLAFRSAVKGDKHRQARSETCPQSCWAQSHDAQVRRVGSQHGALSQSRRMPHLLSPHEPAPEAVRPEAKPKQN